MTDIPDQDMFEEPAPPPNPIATAMNTSTIVVWMQEYADTLRLRSQLAEAETIAEAARRLIILTDVFDHIAITVAYASEQLPHLTGEALEDTHPG